jgi:hypothetical protein
MIRVIEKYRGGFKHKGIQYYPEGYSETKLHELYNNGFENFIEKIEDEDIELKSEIESIGENEFFEDKLIKPKRKRK